MCKALRRIVKNLALSARKIDVSAAGFSFADQPKVWVRDISPAPV